MRIGVHAADTNHEYTAYLYVKLNPFDSQIKMQIGERELLCA